MKKTVLASLVALSCGSQAASLDSLNISGFGSVGIGKASNDAGYASYTDEKFDTQQDTIVGLQFDFDINDKAKFTTQIVANGRYEFEPAFETAYLTYQLDGLTVRAGKMRPPLFMYSDYLDVGYAYPMIRPSQEVYEHVIVSSYTGGELLIPFDIGDTTLQLQPFAGTSQVEERDSPYGKVDLNKTFGLAAHWYVDDYTFRVSYASAETSYAGDLDKLDTDNEDYKKYVSAMFDNQNSSFASIGAQYDNGQLLAVIEGVRISVDGTYADSDAASGLVAYRIADVMPYASIGWKKSTDNNERTIPLEKTINDYKTTSYSLGARWDFAQNIAFKADVTYVDFQGTSGRLASNIDQTGQIKQDDTIVYAASIDFVF